MSILISFDPGKYKCGLIIANTQSNHVLIANVIEVSQVYDLINKWNREFCVDLIVIGDGTTSNDWIYNLKKIAPVQIVDESESTLKSRYRYWELSPPSFWIRWIPRGLLFPPENLDAVAALVILEKYLGRKLEWNGPYIFKN